MEKKKKTVLLVAPILLFPLFSLLFWALGGGNGNAQSAETGEKHKGLNPELPLPSEGSTNEEQDKLRFYEAAERDSVLHAQIKQVDPYLRNQSSVSDHEVVSAQKIAEIEKMMNAPTPDRSVRRAEDSNVSTLLPDRRSALQPDPEILQLNEMMERILDIQHPERINERRSSPATVKTRSSAKTYAAIIPFTQSLITGAVIKMQLIEALPIDSIIIPVHTAINGVVQLNGERLEIRIRSLRSGDQILPVNFSVFDLDGLEGIYIPGAVGRESAKESAASAIGGTDVLSLDPSLKAQAAGAGINAVKKLFTKKVRAVRVQVKAGYRVLLREPLN